MKNVLIILLIALFSGCASLEPTAVSSNDIGLQQNMEFSSSPEDVATAIKSSFAGFKWKLLYEGDSLPDKNYSSFSNMSHNVFSKDEGQYDQIAFDKILSPNQAPSYYLQAKTPTSAFSFGAEIFAVIYKTNTGGAVLALSASSGQALEKKKLPKYISNLAEEVNLIID